MRALIAKITTTLLVLGFAAAPCSAQRRQRHRRVRTSANETEKKPPPAADKSEAEALALAAVEECVANGEKPHPEVSVKANVLCGKAISMPKPPYPAVALAAKASGPVAVQVVVDERGRVIWARAVNGHPLLQAASVRAACRARYTPTEISGRPVKVATIISYNFVAQ